MSSLDTATELIFSFNVEDDFEGSSFPVEGRTLKPAAITTPDGEIVGWTEIKLFRRATFFNGRVPMRCKVRDDQGGIAWVVDDDYGVHDGTGAALGRIWYKPTPFLARSSKAVPPRVVLERADGFPVAHAFYRPGTRFWHLPLGMSVEDPETNEVLATLGTGTRANETPVSYSSPTAENVRKLIGALAFYRQRIASLPQGGV